MISNKSYLKLVVLLIVLLFNNVSHGQVTATKLFNKGYYYLSIDKHKAIQYLSECLKLDSNYTDAYYHRGVTHFKLAHYDSALMDFDKSYELNPNLSIILMYKGFTFRNQGKLDEALSSFTDYIMLHPTDTATYSYIVRGKMKYTLGDFEGAVEDYNMASRLKPLEEKYYYYRYRALYEAEQYEKALEAVSDLIKVNPDFYGYHFYKGNVYLAMEQYESAIFMYNVAVIKNYQNADSYKNRADAYHALGKLNKALEDYNTAIALKPEDGSYFSSRGNCKLDMSDKEGACKDWTIADELGFYEDFEKIKQICDETTSSVD